MRTGYRALLAELLGVGWPIGACVGPLISQAGVVANRLRHGVVEAVSWIVLGRVRQPMGYFCKLYVNEMRSVCLNNAQASSLVMRLTNRWLVVGRDCDEDGWQQLRIDSSAIGRLDPEAPADADLFMAYCGRFGGSGGLQLNEREWIEVRDFVATAARTGGAIICSY